MKSSNKAHLSSISFSSYKVHIMIINMFHIFFRIFYKIVNGYPQTDKITLKAIFCRLSLAPLLPLHSFYPTLFQCSSFFQSSCLSVMSHTPPILSWSKFHKTNAKGSIIVSSAAITLPVT